MTLNRANPDSAVTRPDHHPDLAYTVSASPAFTLHGSLIRLIMVVIVVVCCGHVDNNSVV